MGRLTLIMMLSALVLLTTFGTWSYLSMTIGDCAPHAPAFDDLPRKAQLSREKRERPKESEMSDQWIVLTTINPPTPAVKTLATLPGWNVVVVGDRKTPRDWHWPNCTYLSMDAQVKLGYATSKHVPENSYARKNIGYLYAIERGAKVIYETDDDNQLLQRGIPFLPVRADGVANDHRLDEKGQSGVVVNPYPHFGQPTMWPRGYPLLAIGEAYASKGYRRLHNVSVPVQQYLANGDPDVDAIFRLTRKTHGVPIDIAFDASAPPLMLPPGQFAPYNTQNTVYHYTAFWGLVIPVSTAFRVCDIWRGYWVQRMLWEIGGALMFGQPTVYQDRNEHNYELDFADELDLYASAGALVNHLREWRADSATDTLYDRMCQLFAFLTEHEYVDARDAALIGDWVRDLHAMGYEPPTLVKDPLDYEGWSGATTKA